MVLAADSSWRVAVVRDEGPDGALGSALQRQGLTPVACPVLVEGPLAACNPINWRATLLRRRRGYGWQAQPTQSTPGVTPADRA